MVLPIIVRDKVTYAAVQSGLSARSGRSQRSRKKPCKAMSCAQPDCTAPETVRLDAVSGYNTYHIAASCSEHMDDVKFVWGADRVDRGGYYRWTKLRTPAAASQLDLGAEALKPQF